MNNFYIKKLIGNAPYGMLTATETSLLKEYSFFGNGEGRNIWPGIKTLIRQTKLSRSTIIRNTKNLVKKQFLIEKFRPLPGSWFPVCYEMNIQLLEKVQVVNKPEHQYFNQHYSRAGHKNSGVILDDIELNNQCHDDANRCHGDPQSTQNNFIKEDLPHTYVELASNSTSISSMTGQKNSGVTKYQNSEVSTDNKVKETTNNSFSKKEYSSKDANPKKLNSKTLAPVVKTIFEFWMEILNHPKAKLDTKRHSCIISALKLGYTEEELKKAIIGVSKSPYHMGKNKYGVVYDHLSLILRDSECIERFIQFADTPPTIQKENVATGKNRRNFMDEHHDNMRVWKKIGDSLCPELQKHFYPYGDPYNTTSSITNI